MTAEFFQMAKDMGVIFHTQQVSNGGVLRTDISLIKKRLGYGLTWNVRKQIILC